MPATPVDPLTARRWRKGRIGDAQTVPTVGERVSVLHEGDGVRVEEIVSSAQIDLAEQDQDQDHDEWVVLLSGGATVLIEDQPVTMAAGDWLLLPAHLRHTVVRTRPGTRWLAVHLPAAETP